MIHSPFPILHSRFIIFFDTMAGEGFIWCCGNLGNGISWVKLRADAPGSPIDQKSPLAAGAASGLRISGKDYLASFFSIFSIFPMAGMRAPAPGLTVYRKLSQLEPEALMRGTL